MAVEAPPVDLAVEAAPPPRRPSRSRPPAGLAVAGAAVAVAALLPLGYLLVRASDAGLDGVVDILTGPRAGGLLLRSALLALTVTASCVAIAVPIAWLTTRSDLPGRAAGAVVASLPLVVPSYIAAYALVSASGPGGLLVEWLEPLGVTSVPRVEGLFGAWLVLTLVSYPYVLLPARAALAGADPSVEEASRALGRGPWATFWRITLPQLRPAVGAGALLVMLYTLSDFGAVSLVRYDTFTRAIFVEYQSSFDRTPAAVLALMLVGLCAVVLVAEARTRGRGAYHRVHGSAERRAQPVGLGRWRWVAVGAMSGVVVVALVLPLTIVGVWFGRGLSQGQGLDVSWAAAQRSLEASALGALATVVLAWPVAHLAARYPGRFSGTVERASWLTHALPGVVVALSLVFFGSRAVPAVYQTRTLLVLAYVVLFLPLAVGSLDTSLRQVSPSLEEASRSLGAGRFETFRRVLLPLVRPGVAAGLALTFLTVMKELPATLLLAPTGYTTLATEIWNASAEAFFARAAAPALLLVLLSSVPLAVLVTRQSRRT
ncbi:MAG TPA: iron ABC transporter permease [Acidimicrobiia bacterium]|nr:iron ABC transporter permease [Acidimicrobiia bacterium]